METSPTMGRAELGRLSAAWRGEASDFTPLLNQQLDVLGEAIGIDLVSVGKTEVATDGGRRIDIVASADDGAEFVIENQYGRANHDHLTRGLAYAVARRARGLIVVAEEHRDEFRAVAQYLNELGELEPTKGIAVWLVEAKAIRIGDSPWAPLFAAVVEPNRFTASIEEAKQRERRLPTADAFWAQFTEPALLKAAQAVISAWEDRGRRWRLGPDHVVLMGVGPAARRLAQRYSDLRRRRRCNPIRRLPRQEHWPPDSCPHLAALPRGFPRTVRTCAAEESDQPRMAETRSGREAHRVLRQCRSRARSPARGGALSPAVSVS
jgi:hypothetical protein